jgi:hypothetical protein
MSQKTHPFHLREKLDSELNEDDGSDVLTVLKT